VIPTFHITQDEYLASPRDSAISVGGMSMARHPLHCELLFGDDEQLKTIGIPTPDEIVKHKLERLEEAYAEKNIHSYVFTHARPFRFQALLDAKFWQDPLLGWYEVAGDVWTDTEGPGKNADIWRSEVFCTMHCHMTMSEEEFAFFQTLKEVQVFRGADSSKHARTGLSWTLDRNKAMWFAKRYSSKTPWLAEATVKRPQIAAVFLGRGEKEVIVARPPRGAKAIRL
jgi:hypothetical protein